MIIGVNIISILLFIIVFFYIWKVYERSMFFDISLLYTFVILLAPFILFIINFIFLYINHSSYLYFSFSPLLIPVTYWVYNNITNYNSKKSYRYFKSFSSNIIEIAKDNNLNIYNEDIRIRVKKGKDIDIILNFPPANDEKQILLLINELEKLVQIMFKKYNVKFLVDKKR